LGGKREVVRIVYDKRYLALPGSWLQKNLRGRVSYQWRDEDGNGVPEQVYAYDYDALGNVGNLYVYVEDLKGFGGSNGWKRMRYEYDLVSKKVKYVGYQEGQADQWLHKYRYDGMNRLVDVQTSRDGWYWERDAWYKYYLHRVLGRVMLGERLVQGLDKVYTINGWVKGENAWRLDSVLDLGQDGRMGGVYQYVAKDVMGYELKYFSGDYKAVGLYNTNTFSNFVSLYNGNIAMSVLQQDTMEVMGRRYRYDALNRLKSVDALMGVGFTVFSGYRERFSYDRDGNITRLTRYAKASMMDSLKYNYYAGNNRLEYVNDVVSASSFTNDIDNQGVGNYKYDKTGNLVEDVSESTRIHWTYYNKIKQIDSVKLTAPKYGLILGTKLRMKYDALGNRVVKEVPKKKQKEIYVRDAQGNVIALYEVKQDSLYSKEFYMYGSNRLGYIEDNVFLGRKCIGKWCNVLTPVLPMFPSTLSNSVSIVFGKKRYELSDWLGNVRVVINDRKTPVNSGNATVGYKAQVVSVSDYYSFGSEIAERTYEVVKPLYRFGFQAQEKDNEIYGKGNTYYFKFREHDARIGRFWSVDPLAAKYPHYSPYQFSGNRLTDMVELEGLEPARAGKYDGEGAIDSKKDEKGASIPGTENQRWVWKKGIWEAVEAGVTSGELGRLFKNANQTLIKKVETILNLEGKMYGIDSQMELNAFIAQTGYETGGYRDLEENLNYTPERARKVFPTKLKGVSDEELSQLLSNKVKFAQKIYGGKGDIDYRGRGLIHVTYYENYKAVSKRYNDIYGTNYNFTKTPNMLSSDYDIAVRSALIFCEYKGIFSLPKVDIDEITRRVTGGGSRSEDKRLELFNRVNSVIK
jgi:predicted chitinase